MQVRYHFTPIQENEGGNKRSSVWGWGGDKKGSDGEGWQMKRSKVGIIESRPHAVLCHTTTCWLIPISDLCPSRQSFKVHQSKAVATTSRSGHYQQLHLVTASKAHRYSNQTATPAVCGSPSAELSPTR